MSGPRAQRRAMLEQQILELGRVQLAQVGAADLSVRAIARELNLVSSAVYRYVESRDELLTRLVVAGYTELADAVTDALTGCPDDDHLARIDTLAHTFRSWALANPAEFALLYGSPVPGYHAPPERTTEPGTRVIALLLATISEAVDAGDLNSPVPSPSPATADDLSGIREEFAAVADLSLLDDATLIAGIAFWTWLIGTTTQETFGGFGPGIVDPRALFAAQLRTQVFLLGGH